MMKNANKQRIKGYTTFLEYLIMKAPNHVTLKRLLSSAIYGCVDRISGDFQ